MGTQLARCTPLSPHTLPAVGQAQIQLLGAQALPLLPAHILSSGRCMKLVNVTSMFLGQNMQRGGLVVRLRLGGPHPESHSST